METWRPKGWKNPYPISVVNGTNEYADDTAFSAYEKGADDIFNALFKLAKESPTKTFTIDSRIVNIYEEGK